MRIQDNGITAKEYHESEAQRVEKKIEELSELCKALSTVSIYATFSERVEGELSAVYGRALKDIRKNRAEYKRHIELAGE